MISSAQNVVIIFLLAWITEDVKTQGTEEVFLHGPSSKVEVGSRVILKCSVPEEDHLPVMSLSHHQHTLIQREGIRLEKVELLDGPRHMGIIYTIDRVLAQDAGNYTCVSTWDLPHRQGVTAYSLGLVSRNITLDITPRAATVIVGAELQLFCDLITTKDSPTMIYWHKYAEANTSIYSSGGNSLLIHVVSTNQSGCYYCSVIDDLGTRVISQISNISVLEYHTQKPPLGAPNHIYKLVLPVVISFTIFVILASGFAIYFTKRGKARTERLPQMMRKVRMGRVRNKQEGTPQKEEETQRASCSSYLEILEDEQDEPQVGIQHRGSTERDSLPQLPVSNSRAASKQITLRPGIYLDMGGGKNTANVTDQCLKHKVDTVQTDDYIDMKDRIEEEHSKARRERLPQMMQKVIVGRARNKQESIPQKQKEAQKASCASYLEILEDEQDEPHVGIQHRGSTERDCLPQLPASNSRAASKQVTLRPGVYLDMEGGKNTDNATDHCLEYKADVLQIQMKDKMAEDYDERKPTLEVEDYLDPQCSCGAGTYEEMNEADIVTSQLQTHKSETSLYETGRLHQYEGLHYKQQEVSIGAWIQQNNISVLTAEMLHRERVCTMEDLRELTDQDIRDLSLPIGDRNKLRSAVKRLKYAAP